MKRFNYRSICALALACLLFALAFAQSNAQPIQQINVPLGELPAGENVVLEFEVNVASVIPNGFTEISAQGVVSGDNFISLLTDDPAVGGAADPTVTPIQALDLGVIALNSPGAACGLTGSENVTITIFNYASVAQSNFDVSFDITGPVNSSTTETVAQTVPASGGTLMYTFSATADFSVPGSYSVTVKTMLTGDSQPGNDALNTNVLSSPPVVVNAGPDHFITEFQSVQIGGSPTVSSGTPPFSYSWTPTTGLDDPAVDNPTVTLDAPATYTVVVTDNAGCTSSDVVAVDYIDLRTVIQIAIADIDVVLQNQWLSWRAKYKLQAARADLVNTLNYLDADNWSNAAVALESAIDHCEDAMGYGANLTAMFNNLLEPTHSLAVLTLQVAQPLAGTNGQLNAAIDYAEDKLADGEQEQAWHDYPDAIKDYLYSYGGSRYVIENGPGGLPKASKVAAKSPQSSQLTEIVANASEDGVQVTWSSIFETENKGFYIYRAAQPIDAMGKVDLQKKSGVPREADFVRLNSKRIDGSGTSLQRKNYSYTDNDVSAGYTYYYKITLENSGRNNNGSGAAVEPYGTVSEVVSDTPAGQAKKASVVNIDVPLTFTLHQNYPNPFNPSTKIQFALPVASTVTLEIYNTAGQRIRTLVSGNHAPGTYEIEWDARNDSGQNVASGVYMYHLQAGTFSEVRKMSLLR